MSNLSLGRDVANKRERKWTTANKVANLIPYVGMRRYGSLININPSEGDQRKKPQWRTLIFDDYHIFLAHLIFVEQESKITLARSREC